MVNMSTTFTTLANADTRDIYTKIIATVSGTNYTITGSDSICELTVEESTASDNIQLGATCSSILKAKLRNISFTIPNATLKPYISFDNSEWCPLGVYNVADVVEKNGEYEITAYDKIAFLTDKYTPTTGTTFAQMITAMGLELETGQTVPSVSITTAYDGTERDYLGWIAGYMGRNARMNRNGKLEFVWYTEQQVELDEEVIKVNGFEKSTKDTQTITALVSGYGENPLEVGSGRTITFANPFMTQSQLQSIWNDIITSSGFEWQPCTVDTFGNPAIEVGDSITVSQDLTFYSVPIMHQEISIKGGLEIKIDSFGESDEQAIVDVGGIQEYVDRNSTEFKQEVERVTNALNNAEGVYGGTYEKIYETIGGNQRPTGFKIIKDNDNRSYWQFDYNGLRFTNDNGTTYKVGLSNTGTVMADNIVAGSTISNNFTCNNLTITGGTVNISTSSQYSSVIMLNAQTSGYKYRASMSASGFYADIQTTSGTDYKSMDYTYDGIYQTTTEGNAPDKGMVLFDDGTLCGIMPQKVVNGVMGTGDIYCDVIQSTGGFYKLINGQWVEITNTAVFG